MNIAFAAIQVPRLNHIELIEDAPWNIHQRMAWQCGVIVMTGENATPTIVHGQQKFV